MRSMTEGLLQNKKTTPQALTRRLPLHRGAIPPAVLSALFRHEQHHKDDHGDNHKDGEDNAKGHARITA